MEQFNDVAQMLDLLVQPAFSVKDGLIAQLNQAAQCRLLTAGSQISDILATGAQEYADFTNGCLYLTLNVLGHHCGASVTRIDGYDIFLLEKEDTAADLQTMALAARELREPLAKVMTAADRLFPTLDEESEGARQQAAQINSGLHQLLRLIGNMSDAARYCTEAPPIMETLDVCAILDEIFRKAAALVEHKGITLRFTNLKTGVYCLVDAEKIERAVYNIISNAVKFTPEGGTIQAQLLRHGNRLQLTVQDSGSGVPPQLRGSIHYRYLREPCIEDSRYGIGLGMVLIRAAASAHGGTVLLEYPENQGTRITLSFPIRQSTNCLLRSPQMRIDYAGGWDHGLLELSGELPSDLYKISSIN